MGAVIPRSKSKIPVVTNLICFISFPPDYSCPPTRSERCCVIERFLIGDVSRRLPQVLHPDDAGTFLPRQRKLRSRELWRLPTGQGREPPASQGFLAAIPASGFQNRR